MIRYQYDLNGLSPDHLNGFFAGWLNPPDRETHWRILQGSDEVVLAVDEKTGAVVGFITAIADGVLAAYIPLLEVRPDYKGRGIGRELTRRMVEKLEGYYMIDLICDPNLQAFYEPLGMRSHFAMMIRDFKHQSGRRHTVPPGV
jgi:ribosomal protein S18 acetylase RimI-like enzyme